MITERTTATSTTSPAATRSPIWPRELAYLVTTAWENGEMAALRDLLEPHEQYFAGMFCSTHDQEIAEMVAASIRTLVNWLHQPTSGTDMDVQVALGVLKHLAQERPSASLVM